MRALAILLLAALPAGAQERRPAPDYFVSAAHDLMSANAIAVSCPSLSINPGTANTRSEQTLARLVEDGFDPAAMESEMIDPTEAFAQLRTAFLERHGLSDGAASDVVCAAGRAEIAEESGIGALLLEVER